MNKLNAVYMEKKHTVRQLETQRDRNDVVINRWIDQWRVRRRNQKLFGFWKNYSKTKGDEKRSVDFCQDFYQRGLIFRTIRHWKLYSQVAGNRMYERKVKENITIEVKAKVQELQNQQEFLEALIKELEEKHRIELRKKAILKNQCD